MKTEILMQYGIDAESGIERCMNDEALYEKILMYFIDDTSFERAKEAFAKKDRKALFECIHEFKGICGNAAMTKLYDEVCVLVELLRKSAGTDEQIAELLDKIENVCNYTKDGIVKAVAT